MGILVLASPLYYWDISSQLKAFVDRTFSYPVADFITNSKKSRLLIASSARVKTQGRLPYSRHMITCQKLRN
jgi:multimeric flavodoxin WrbA